jgi:hypothetical protein
MNSHSGTKNNNIRRTKATAAIPMAGAIITAALLLSGLSLITSYQPVIAQENMTGGGGATTTDNATSRMGGNATSALGGGGANQSTSDVRMNIEQARMALQNNDTQGARMYLDMALSALGGGTQGNLTSSMGGITNATSGGGIGGGGNTTDGGGGGGPLAGMLGGGGNTTDGGGGGGPLAGIFGGGQ